MDSNNNIATPTTPSTHAQQGNTRSIMRSRNFKRTYSGPYRVGNRSLAQQQFFQSQNQLRAHNISQNRKQLFPSRSFSEGVTKPYRNIDIIEDGGECFTMPGRACDWGLIAKRTQFASPCA
mmetsp:Transcript_19121/g.29056  ORF Transcript_19121/g.29056 Transcript_19121/m.29056 type:complete len:121 (+) Transcript_19121:1-363(+)